MLWEREVPIGISSQGYDWERIGVHMHRSKTCQLHWKGFCVCIQFYYPLHIFALKHNRISPFAISDESTNSFLCINKNAFQSKAHLLLANRKSNTYNLTMEWPWPQTSQNKLNWCPGSKISIFHEMTLTLTQWPW